MNTKCFSILLVITALIPILFSCKKPLDSFSLASPNDGLSLEVKLTDNKLNYRVSQRGKEIIGVSELEIFPGELVAVVEASESEKDTTWKPVWGQQSSIQDNYKQLTLHIDCGGVGGKLLARAYDQGVAFRFVLDEGEKPKEAVFKCEYALSEGSNLYTPAGESEPLGPVSLSGLTDYLQEKTRRKISVPLVVEPQGQQLFIALLESDLYAAKGIRPMQLGISEGKVAAVNKVELSKEEWTSPWRVLLIGETAGDLVVNTVPINLATACELEETDWVKPGKTLWDWRVHGYTAPDGFVYGIDNESYYRFIDFAAETGVDYFLIDDAWYKHVTKGSFELSEKLDLQAVIDYAVDKEVELMLYYDRRHGEYGDDELFPYYQSLGMKGIKYGFMGSDVDFSREAIQKSAASNLLIDFHDGPVPFTGIRRTFPNAITREYCHAQQDSRRAFTPEAFIKMALINAITGPLDMNNGNFDLTGINAGLRQKGPRKTNSYFSTVASEAARTLVVFSGLVCIPDAPEAYAAKADLFEFIQKMPVGKWDESRVLHSKMDEYISTGRRRGKEWFVGSVYSQKGGTLDIDLDFLEEGIEYDITYYEDTEETHCKTNPEAYRVRKGSVEKGEIVKAVMASGGGHCMWIRPAK
ncbi:glycoside hydrolase family 97 catalytic domain-containing protein [Flammeovirgaceae bacterium SG7u.111]|nr:glycoside hydrolase family 97 catalytic domain-containing protein [Flammeovirgaceae bacterium SG7u.132]WPO37928.1 glycoside hydrolase family 97 catalytic domain-containing protein [Flammeovirgaceae bacterium SG7u.111]